MSILGLVLDVHRHPGLCIVDEKNVCLAGCSRLATIFRYNLWMINGYKEWIRFDERYSSCYWQFTVNYDINRAKFKLYTSQLTQDGKVDPLSENEHYAGVITLTFLLTCGYSVSNIYMHDEYEQTITNMFHIKHKLMETKLCNDVVDIIVGYYIISDDFLKTFESILEFDDVYYTDGCHARFFENFKMISGSKLESSARPIHSTYLDHQQDHYTQ
jgi:hypothetical protein